MVIKRVKSSLQKQTNFFKKKVTKYPKNIRTTEAKTATLNIKSKIKHH